MQNFGMKTWIFHPVTWNGCVALLMAQNIVHCFVPSFFGTGSILCRPRSQKSPLHSGKCENTFLSKANSGLVSDALQIGCIPFFFTVAVCCVCVSCRGTWRSWLWPSTWGTCSSSTPACCLRGAFSFLPASSAPWVTFTPPTVLPLKEQNHVNLLESQTCNQSFFIFIFFTPVTLELKGLLFFFFLCPAYVLRARAQRCVISHVLATHLYPSTATTPAGLHLVRNIHTYLPADQYTLLFTWLPFSVPADLLNQSPICLPSHLATYL